MAMHWELFISLWAMTFVFYILCTMIKKKCHLDTLRIRLPLIYESKFKISLFAYPIIGPKRLAKSFQIRLGWWRPIFFYPFSGPSQWSQYHHNSKVYFWKTSLQELPFTSSILTRLVEMQYKVSRLAWPQLWGFEDKGPVQIPSPALRGFWWYRISVFGSFGQPGQYIKKKLGADFEQLLRVVFSCFQGQKKIKFF